MDPTGCATATSTVDRGEPCADVQDADVQYCTTVLLYRVFYGCSLFGCSGAEPANAALFQPRTTVVQIQEGLGQYELKSTRVGILSLGIPATDPSLRIRRPLVLYRGHSEEYELVPLPSY